MRTTALASDQRHSATQVPRLILLTDDERMPDPSGIIPSLPAGSAVIVRARSEITRITLAQSLSGLCRHHQVVLLVSSTHPPDGLIGDGVHIPEAARKNWRCRDFHRLRPSLVTTSAHSLASAYHADSWGADAVLLSPIAPTDSHPGAPCLGWWRGAAICTRLSIPTVALGGITPALAGRAFSLGFSGIAGIGIFADL